MTPTTLSYIALAAAVGPFFGSILVATAKEPQRQLRLGLAIAVTSLVALGVFILAGPVAGGQTVTVSTYQVSPMLAIEYGVDRLGLLFAVTAASLWVLTTLYSHGYLADGRHQRRYFTFLTFALGATLGVAWSANLFTLYAFYELLTLATYPLVVYETGPAAARAGRTYIIYSFVGASLVLLGITGTLMLGGSLDFVPGGLLAGIPVTPGVYITALLYLSGFGVKAAIMPLHGWLPQAMAAPTPVSALLHAVAVVKSGIFGILRVMFFVFGRDLLARSGINMIIMAVAAMTILLASLSALRQDVLKRRLAYSTISQLSYITFGVASLTAAGMTGGLLHLFMHALMKITLFFCAGAIITQTGRTRISQLDGIGRKMPWTMGAFAVAALGMVGIAPVAGFVSKWYLLQGSAQATGWLGIAILSTSSLLNAAYFFPILTRAFFKPWREQDAPADEDGAHGSHGSHGAGAHVASAGHGAAAGHGAGAVSSSAAGGRWEAPATMLVPIVLLAVACLVVGFWPQLPLDLVVRLVGEL